MLVLLVLCYLGLRILVNSRFGNVLVAIRENPERAEMLGYDVRRYQLVAFVIGSTLAGLSGVLYTAWGQYITPAAMALPAAAMPIIWVAVGGRKDLTATLIGTLFVLWLFQTLIVISQQYALIVMGALLLVTILFMPGGYIVWVVANRDAIFNGAGSGPSAWRSRSRRERWSVRMTVLLETTNLNKHFGGLKAVDDLSLAVEEGELHCLIGPNGAGKSTFFRLILGRYPPTAGTVRFYGEDITQLHAAARIRRGMSIKIQVPGIFPELPVRQNLVIALQTGSQSRN